MSASDEHFVYRRAGAEDAVALARFAADSFVATFGHLYPAEDLAAYLRSSYAPDTLAAELAAPGVCAVLAVQADAIVGYAMWGPVELPAPEAEKSRGVELYRLYVEERVKGAGVAHALMRAVVADARRAGAASLWLSVWEHNDRAQGFYRRYGFAHAGEHAFMVGRVADRDFIWRMAL